MLSLLAVLVLALTTCVTAQLTAVRSEWMTAEVFGVVNSKIFHAHVAPNSFKKNLKFIAGGKDQATKILWRPTAIAYGNDSQRVDVFYTTEDFKLYHKWSEGGSFLPDDSPDSPGENLNGSFRGFVSATSFKADQFDLIAWGEDYSYSYRGFEDGKWQPEDWDSIGGNFMTPPASVRVGSSVYVYGVDKDEKTVKYKVWDGKSWTPSQTGWEAGPPGQFYPTAPTAVSWSDERVDVFGVGADHSLRHCHWVLANRSCEAWGWVSSISWATQPAITTLGSEAYEMIYPFADAERRLAFFRVDFNSTGASEWHRQPILPFRSDPAAVALTKKGTLWIALAEGPSGGNETLLAVRGWDGKYWPDDETWLDAGTVQPAEDTSEEGAGRKSDENPEFLAQVPRYLDLK